MPAMDKSAQKMRLNYLLSGPQPPSSMGQSCEKPYSGQSLAPVRPGISTSLAATGTEDRSQGKLTARLLPEAPTTKPESTTLPRPPVLPTPSAPPASEHLPFSMGLNSQSRLPFPVDHRRSATGQPVEQPLQFQIQSERLHQQYQHFQPSLPVVRDARSDPSMPHSYRNPTAVSPGSQQQPESSQSASGLHCSTSSNKGAASQSGNSTASQAFPLKRRDDRSTGSATDIGVGSGQRRSHTCHCGKSFNKREHLKRHTMLVHEELRPFQCDVCELRFGTKQNMEVHLSTRKHRQRLAFRRVHSASARGTMSGEPVDGGVLYRDDQSR